VHLEPLPACGVLRVTFPATRRPNIGFAAAASRWPFQAQPGAARLPWLPTPAALRLPGPGVGCPAPAALRLPGPGVGCPGLPGSAASAAAVRPGLPWHPCGCATLILGTTRARLRRPAACDGPA